MMYICITLITYHNAIIYNYNKNYTMRMLNGAYV